MDLATLDLKLLALYMQLIKTIVIDVYTAQYIVHVSILLQTICSHLYIIKKIKNLKV